MKILAIGAHPDDIEYGCGGTLVKFREQWDADIYFFVATDGSFGGSPEVRIREQEDAAGLLGVEKIFWGELPDTGLRADSVLIKKLEKSIKECAPDIIFVNNPEDTHQDHRALAEAAIVAARYQRKVLFYEDFTSVNYEPTIFVDIANEIEGKEELLKRHRSQVERDYPSELDMIESVRAVANFRGFQAKVKYAEGFRALRFLLGDIK